MEPEERIASSNVNLFRRMYSDVGYCLQCSSCHCSTLCSLLCPCVKWFGRPEKSGMELIWLLADLFSFREFQKWELCEFFHEIDFKPSEWSFHNVTLPQKCSYQYKQWLNFCSVCVSGCLCVCILPGGPTHRFQALRYGHFLFQFDWLQVRSHDFTWLDLTLYFVHNL